MTFLKLNCLKFVTGASLFFAFLTQLSGSIENGKNLLHSSKNVGQLFT